MNLLVKNDSEALFLCKTRFLKKKTDDLNIESE